MMQRMINSRLYSMSFLNASIFDMKADAVASPNSSGLDSAWREPIRVHITENELSNDEGRRARVAI